MTNSETISVPNVVGLKQPEAEAALKNAGLTVGTTKAVSSSTVQSGKVSEANPAQGTLVSPGSAVALEVSSGPAKIAVPPVVGLTRPAAETTLKNHGLAVGALKTHYSDSIPDGGISSASPAAGTMVDPATPIDLELSAGPEPSLSQYIVPILFTILGIIILGFIGYIVTENGRGFIKSLADDRSARGLITFLIAITTVGIAIILAVSTLVLPEGDAGDKRFDRGKQILSVMVAVLATIVGFYFGSAVSGPAGAQPPTPTELTITSSTLPDGIVGTAYFETLKASGGTAPLKWSAKQPLPDGLALDPATGIISGTPKTPQPKTTYTFTVTDGGKPAASKSVDLNLEVKKS